MFDIGIPNQGVERQDMPQISPTMVQEFVIYLREQGIEVFKRKINVMELQPYQKELDSDKLKALMKTGYDKLSNGIPIFVSQEHVIADGHTRWAALRLIDKNADIPIFEVQTNVEQLLSLMKQFENNNIEGEI